MYILECDNETGCLKKRTISSNGAFLNTWYSYKISCLKHNNYSDYWRSLKIASKSYYYNRGKIKITSGLTRKEIQLTTTKRPEGR